MKTTRIYMQSNTLVECAAATLRWQQSSESTYFSNATVKDVSLDLQCAWCAIARLWPLALWAAITDNVVVLSLFATARNLLQCWRGQRPEFDNYHTFAVGRPQRKMTDKGSRCCQCGHPLSHSPTGPETVLVSSYVSKFRKSRHFLETYQALHLPTGGARP
jgi:hypothetical protein